MQTKDAHGLAEVIAERYRDDPVAFAHEVLGVFLRSKQREILRSVFQNRRTAVPSGHGVGKTFAAAAAALAFLYLRAPSKVITTAPTHTQVCALLWSEINALFNQRLSPRGFPGECLQTMLGVQDDWFAIGLSPKDTESERIQGFHSEHVLVILDGAPRVSKAIFQGADSLTSAGDAH